MASPIDLIKTAAQQINAADPGNLPGYPIMINSARVGRRVDVDQYQVSFYCEAPLPYVSVRGASSRFPASSYVDNRVASKQGWFSRIMIRFFVSPVGVQNLIENLGDRRVVTSALDRVCDQK